MHLVLLGDSVFDNSAYVPQGKDVLTQLRTLLSPGWAVSLLAEDGSTTDRLTTQLARLPSDTTHLVMSVGGNDALEHVHILDACAHSFLEVLAYLADAAEIFQERYRAALSMVVERGLPTTVCTIYEGRLDQSVRRQARAALAVFNDVLLREAFAQGVGVIDLRLVCSDDADYATPIEPSARGGEKIARAIAAAVGERSHASRSEVFVPLASRVGAEGGR